MNVQDNHGFFFLKGRKKLVLNDRCQSQTLLPFGRTRKLAKRGSVVSVSSSQAISRFSIRRWLLYFWAGPPMACELFRVLPLPALLEVMFEHLLPIIVVFRFGNGRGRKQCHPNSWEHYSRSMQWWPPNCMEGSLYHHHRAFS